MVLDPDSLATLATPYLVKGAEAFTKTAGEKLGEKIIGLCWAVTNKFKGDSYAEQTLNRAKEMPELEDRQSALKAVLMEKIKSDSNFAEEIKIMLDGMPEGTTPSYTAFDQRRQNVGSQINIGNMQGSVNTGTK